MKRYLFFFVRHRFQIGSGVHPLSCVLGTWDSFPGVKRQRPGPEADHPPQSSAKVKNAWSCTSTHTSSGVVLTEAQGKIYLYLYFCLTIHISLYLLISL